MKTNQSKLIKKRSEIEKLRKASTISSALHSLAMSQTVIGKSETDLATYLNKQRECTKASGWAYPTIIGSAGRSTILHAKPTKKILNENELVLVDMGVKYEGYCSDITRTWPAGKKFSKEQKVIYQIVLNTQKECIKRVKPGVSLYDLDDFCRKDLLDQLRSKGIVKSKNIDRYFTHKTSHWIGQDVHDKCPYQYLDKSPVILSPNMCFTIEPGLYFKESKSKYEGIGIRIEDVIRVTEEGGETLSQVPKEIDEIEAIRAIKI